MRLVRRMARSKWSCRTQVILPVRLEVRRNPAALGLGPGERDYSMGVLDFTDNLHLLALKPGVKPVVWECDLNSSITDSHVELSIHQCIKPLFVCGVPYWLVKVLHNPRHNNLVQHVIQKVTENNEIK